MRVECNLRRLLSVGALYVVLLIVLSALVLPASVAAKPDQAGTVLPERAPVPGKQVDIAGEDPVPKAQSPSQYSWVILPPGATQSPAVANASWETGGQWEAALKAAAENRARDCIAALDAWDAPNYDQELLGLRLRFAAAVTTEDKAAADSLFYRVSWRDQGMTAARLAAWRSLLEGDPESASNSSQGLRGREAEAVRAMADWSRGDLSREYTLPDDPRFSSDVFLVLYGAARVRSGQGRYGTQDARDILERLDADRIPASWIQVYEDLGRPTGQDPADRLWEKAVQAFVSHQDSEALGMVNQLIALYPGSSYRGAAYLMRGSLMLTKGDAESAEADLASAAQITGSNLGDALLAARIFVEAGSSPETALTSLNRAYNAAADAQGEAFWLFHRLRIEKLSGMTAAAEATNQLLEEAFGDSPWYERALDDGEPAQWRAPWREVPLIAARGSLVEPPRSGPWGKVLWGDDVLSRTGEEASLVAATSQVQEPQITETVPVLPGTESVSSGTKGWLGVGGGSRETGYADFSILSIQETWKFSAEGDWVTTQEPDYLPRSRRSRVEAHASTEMRGWTWTGEAGALSRNEGSSDVAAPEAVKASGWNLDLGAGSPLHEGTFSGAKVSWSEGVLQANGDQRWSHRDLALSGTGKSGVWEGSLSLNLYSESQPDWNGTPVALRAEAAMDLTDHLRIGGRAALYRGQVMIMPTLAAQWMPQQNLELWAASRPELSRSDFQSVFLSGGDWNLPDFSLDAVERWLDLRGGFKWNARGNTSVHLSGFLWREENTRTWAASGSLWRESAVGTATGRELSADLNWEDPSGWKVRAGGRLSSIHASGVQVAYLPTWTVEGEVGRRVGRWSYGAVLSTVHGRRDETGSGFGSFTKLNLEGGYRPTPHLEVYARLENAGNAPAGRWPGLPSYGRGLFAGVRGLLH